MNFVSLKTIFFGLFCLYSLGLVIFLINDRSFSMPLHHRELFTEDHSTQIEPKTGVKSEKTSSYKFTDPAKAYQILSQLEVVDDSNPSSMYQPNRVIKKPHMNLKIDDTYCDKRRAYFVQFPESVFEEMNYVSDLSLKTLVRNKMLIQVGNDVQPHIGAHMPDTETAIYDIKPEVNNFYTRMALYFERRVGRHFSCVSQVSNHMPGKQALDLKDNLAEAVIQYAKRFDDRPHCFNFNKFFPKTYLMYQKDSCLDFFKVFNSPEYKTLKAEKEIVFMRKVGRDVHMGAGVDPVNDKIEAEIRKLYANGTKCGEVEKKYLLQYFIHNPLLLYGRKFDFRMYMMVASSNPLIAYYHDGFLRVSLMQYDTASTDKRTLLTNMALNYEIYNNARDGIPFQGMGEQELMETQQWLFDRFGKYLLDNKVVEDPNWLDNYLRPELKKAMVHLLRFGLISPYEHSSVYQLYGVDFMLDANMNLWFIEANSAPGLNRFADHLNRFLVKMLADQVEIVMGLLRSRMKRVINYVNEMMVDGSVIEGENGEIIIKGLEGSRMKFNKLNENYFEEEFLPSPTNGFAKIIDGNFKGADRYLGFIDKECL